MSSGATIGYDERKPEEPTADTAPPASPAPEKAATIGYDAADPRAPTAPTPQAPRPAPPSPAAGLRTPAAARPPPVRPAVSAFARPTPAAASPPRAGAAAAATSPRAPGSTAATVPDVAPAASALDATMAATADIAPSVPRVETVSALDATLATDTAAPSSATQSFGATPTGRSITQGNPRTTTVLPRIEGDGESLRLVAADRVRYEPYKTLGAGGMGEVALARDHDIDRQVAIKRLLPDMQTAPTMARFVDEIRIVGSLEHPNIVPIHDVGVDEHGRYFFVMKFVDGETLEHIIEKLDAGDPQYHANYTFDRRREIFVKLLHALQFAHSHGIVHRDIKPANVMVGRYGEVVLMDWGIAKPLDANATTASKSASGSSTSGDSPSPAALLSDSRTHQDETSTSPVGAKTAERERMFRTRHGALIGTPAYMSPEQARGANDTLDVRSDLFSATVLFHEFVSLRHYLASKEHVAELLSAVMDVEPPGPNFAKYAHPHQSLPPAEFMHFIRRGMQRDPAQRWQSADEMIHELENMADGNVRVQCPFTMTKRMTREASRFVDRHPIAAVTAFVMTVLLVLFSIVQVVRTAIA